MYDLIIILGEHRNEKAAFYIGKEVSSRLRNLGLNIKELENPDKRTLLEFLRENPDKELNSLDVVSFLDGFGSKMNRNYRDSYPFLVNFHNYGTNKTQFISSDHLRITRPSPQRDLMLSVFPQLTHLPYSDEIEIAPCRNSFLIELPEIQHYSISKRNLSIVKKLWIKIVMNVMEVILLKQILILLR
ncbi:hypothetical protein COU57_04660 [Candidatus Pacearchaeota archaeon CG10_big_fil_rev_8_21_14_0_10_32_14]|nr:MAG: hypothetical protein COU57_04660 [Candidatus Pacearchaeota archaeon CG10_big_fil_rev_8_21_14_0_10_32_14]